MATEKRKIKRVIDLEGHTIQVLPETSAEQVTLADAGNKFTSTNVEGALAEVAQDIAELETGLANAGKVDDVRNNASDASTSIVTNKIADLSKAVVKEAGKATKGLTVAGQASDAALTSHELSFDGSVEKTIRFNASELSAIVDAAAPNEILIGLQNTGVASDTYNNVSVDSKGRVYSGTNKDYALKSYVDTQDNNKLDKAGGTVTGNLSVNGGVTIGGNLTVNGTTTTVDSTTLQVKDKLIEVAHGNTTKLTTPAGIVVPNYDGTESSGALVFDGDGIASVGDVTLDASGNIDVARSQLQPLATRTGLVNDHLVKYDSDNQTLVDSGKTISDFATAAQGSNADSALSIANANATEITNIKNGTTKVKSAEHADTAGSATSAGTATNATNVTTNINGKAISSIFESNGITVKEATQATTAGNVSSAINGKPIGDIFESDKSTVKKATRVANKLYIEGNQKDGKDNPLSLNYDGHAELSLGLYKENFTLQDTSASNAPYSSAQLRLSYTGVAADQYSAVNVDVFGRVTAGGKSIEWGTSGQTTPSGDLMVGGLFMELQ